MTINLALIEEESQLSCALVCVMAHSGILKCDVFEDAEGSDDGLARGGLTNQIKNNTVVEVCLTTLFFNLT